MPVPSIIRGSDQMFTTIYEGNGGGQKVGKFIPFTDNGTIAKSCIFNHASEPDLARTPSSGGNRKTFTVSAWVKLCTEFGQRRMIFVQGPTGSGNDYFLIEFDANNKLFVSANNGSGGEDLSLITSRTFEDTSKFYHIVVAFDTTQSTASDRVKIYVDGDQITSFSTETYPSQDYDTNVNHTVEAVVGNYTTTGYAFDGYIAEFNLVDGTALTPSTFGLTDTSTGRWIPKSLTGITYGTNGLRLQFANTAGQTIGDDTSGNGNDLTVTNLAAADITTDSPTQNHFTFDPLRLNDWTLSEGNLTCTGTPNSGAGRHSFSNMIIPKSGKYYFEMTVDTNNDSPRYFGLAKADGSVTEGTNANLLPRVVVPRNGGTNDGHFISDGTNSSANGFSTGNGTVINFALDADNEKLYVGKDGSYYDFEGGSGNPTNGTGATFTNIYKNTDWRVANISYSTGTGGGSHTVTWNFGQKTFAHTAPTGFSALQQDNFPDDGKGIPDFVWVKNRDSGSYNHVLYDSSRGVQNYLNSNNTNAQQTGTDGLTKFLKGGFATEDGGFTNNSGNSFVAWNWVANGGTETANTDGSGATYASTIQANQTAGFSIVRFTPGSSSGKVAHGLSQAPEWIVMKDTSRSVLWLIYHKDIGADKYLQFTSAGAATNSTVYSTSPTASLFDPGTGYTSSSSYGATVAYCWHSVSGFSKIGKYVGNQNANGPFVYTGFKPAWIITKSSSTATNWNILDTTRSPINPMTLRLSALDADAEESNRSFDFLSNGFKIRESGTDVNQSGITYVYAAFAEHPFLGNGTNPVTAR